MRFSKKSKSLPRSEIIEEKNTGRNAKFVRLYLLRTIFVRKKIKNFCAIILGAEKESTRVVQRGGTADANILNGIKNSKTPHKFEVLKCCLGVVCGFCAQELREDKKGAIVKIKP